MRPPSPSLPAKAFLISSLPDLRLDGRNLLDITPPLIVFGQEMGTVEVGIGGTRCLAQLSASITRPPPERPFEGMLSIHSEFSAMTGPEYDVGRPSNDEVVLTRTLDKVLRRSDVLDREGLCVVAGQRVWHLTLTVHPLASTSSSSLLTCACLAALISLRHFRIPEVEVIGELEVIVHSPEERAPRPLAINHTPYVFVFAFFPFSTAVVLDPSPLEHSLSSSLLMVAMNPQREICLLQTENNHPSLSNVTSEQSSLGSGISLEDVTQAVKIAAQKAKEMGEIVDRALEEDWATRQSQVQVI